MDAQKIAAVEDIVDDFHFNSPKYDNVSRDDMKTTIDLPDKLLARAKRFAAKQNRSLSDLIGAGLRNELARSSEGNWHKHKRIDWQAITVQGGLPPPEVLGLQNRVRIIDLLGKIDFEPSYDHKK